ncbi:MAG: hypothetical protein WAO35_12485 [Terriglobia bacterium]
METTTPPDTLRTSPQLTPEERLRLWQRLKGTWEGRIPDPAEELKKIRNEWDREDPPGR